MDKLLPPLLTRFRDIHFKLYTEEEFVEIVINVLGREEGVDRDIALLIFTDGVFNRLRSSNIRECVRICIKASLPLILICNPINDSKNVT